mgnify:CR=1 FL=1|tara:strand:+ start:211 stop:915 length:705 start_codon:yes stop_codon:yes gene_type:complete
MLVPLNGTKSIRFSFNSKNSRVKLVPNIVEAFLKFDDVVTLNPQIRAKADAVAGSLGEVEQARALFEWVRDEIPHSKDIGAEQVTCTSSEVLAAGTGICFAKSHLVASMMRHVGIPCGFCYQVFENSLASDSESLALHGLNAIYLTTTSSWHRIDPRGNRADIAASFSTDAEVLAFPEMRFLDDCIYASPLDVVVSGLRHAESITTLWPNLPSTLPAEQGTGDHPLPAEIQTKQ